MDYAPDGGLQEEPDTNQPLKERNPKWINDDYCKFIRLGQFFVDRNNEGILAYVNNHSFIDNPSFRGMRWNLLRSFEQNLHHRSARQQQEKRGCTRRRQRRKRIRHTTGRLNQYLRKNGTQGKECPCRSISSRPIRPRETKIRLLVVAYGGEHPVRETSAVRTGIFLRAEKLRSKGCVRQGLLRYRAVPRQFRGHRDNTGRTADKRQSGRSRNAHPRFHNNGRCRKQIRYEGRTNAGLTLGYYWYSTSCTW